MKSAAWSPVSVESRGSGDPGQPGRATFAIWRPYTHCDSFMSDGPSGRWAAGFHASSCMKWTFSLHSCKLVQNGHSSLSCE